VYFHFRKDPKGLYIPEKGSDRMTTETIKEEWRGFICHECGEKDYVAVDEYWKFVELHEKTCKARRREKIVIR
jgi:hypothetical protein